MANHMNVYFLTFFTYASVHMMRMTYSFNKPNIEQRFGLSHLFVGLLDALIFLSLAVGTLSRYSLLNSSQITLTCLQTAIPTAISFSIIPLYSLFKSENDKQASLFTQLIMVIAFGCFGFFQFTFFPALLTIFSKYFNVKTQATLVGIWSSKSNVGNIVGFGLANFVVFQMARRWETTMLISAVSLMVMALALYYYVDDVQDDRQNQITTKQFFQYMKQKWTTLEFKLYILSFSFFKAILYSYELWTPNFLSQAGYASYSGYIPMVFDISTLFGSFLMGKLYEQDNDVKQQSTLKMLKRYKFFIASLMIILASFCYILAPASITIYFMLGSFMGLFLGGVYNSLQNNEILSNTQNDPRKTDMLSTINIGVGCALVGVLQLIIGVIMHLGEDHSKTNLERKAMGGKAIYVVIAVMGIIAMVLTYARSYVKENQLQQTKGFGQNIQLQNILLKD